ncbi:hypothetical protein Ddc_16257 [Ditylenchus destructor]|nr:hypothetical protein Ddc_16257 [Ditylenchus destructor]
MDSLDSPTKSDTDTNSQLFLSLFSDSPAPISGTPEVMSPTTSNAVTATEQLMELFKHIANKNIDENSLKLVHSPLSQQPSIDLSPPPPSLSVEIHPTSQDSPLATSTSSSVSTTSNAFQFPGKLSSLEQHINFQLQFEAAMASAAAASLSPNSERINNSATPQSKQSSLSPSFFTLPAQLFGNNNKTNIGLENNNESRKRSFIGDADENNNGSDSEHPAPKISRKVSPAVGNNSSFASFFPPNSCSDLLLAAAAAAAANATRAQMSQISRQSEADYRHMPLLNPMAPTRQSNDPFNQQQGSPLQLGNSASAGTKKLRGIITRADFLEKIEKAETLEDCKNIFLSILDVILPGKASQNVAVNIPMQKNFDLARIGPKFIRVNEDCDAYDLHRLFTEFWSSKSHLSIKNIPSAFTRFVLSKVLGEDISKFTYCKLNNGKRGYKQLSNEFVKTITESDTSSKIALRNAVENVIINTCGNARKRVINA